jgi:hypothetical protein
MFSKVEPKLQAGVLTGLGVACADFSTPNMMAIASPITSLMAARGVRFVNFSELRKPGTAIFLIVPEGDAERYKRILSTFIGVAIISNAPPVRLSFPKYARLENPPHSKRETQFKQGREITAIAKRSELESDSLAGSAAFESRVDQWSEAS